MNAFDHHGTVLLKVLIIFVILGILFVLFLPSVEEPRSAARLRTSKINLKQIGLALHIYHDEHDSLPPAYTVDEQGNRLHSWRTLILPYLEEKELYDAIDLTKPWDDPANAHALEKIPQCYQCPGADIDQLKTIYLGIAAEGGIFASSEPVSFKQITDGTSKTLAVTEAPLEYAVHWMQPTDADENVLKSISPEVEVAFRGLLQAVMVDGSTNFINLQISQEELKSLSTYAGGEESEND